MIGVKYIINSKNRKLSKDASVDVTYVTIENSCPKTCAMLKNSCYGELGYVGMQVYKLDEQSEGLSALEIARNEAKAIDASYDGGLIPLGKYMRLHVSGDSRTVKGTNLINSAVKRWKKRGGAVAWTYTHAWKNVPRSAWSNVSILASIDNPQDSTLARSRGYAPAIVVSEFVSDKAFYLKDSTTKFIPCPAQTKDNITCSDCRLCFNANSLYNRDAGIAFAAHGVRKKKIRKLEVIP